MALATLSLKDKLVKVLQFDKAHQATVPATPRVVKATMTIQAFIDKRHEYATAYLDQTEMLYRNGQDWLSIDDLEIYTDGVVLKHRAGQLFLTAQEIKHVKATVKVMVN